MEAIVIYKTDGFCINIYKTFAFIRVKGDCRDSKEANLKYIESKYQAQCNTIYHGLNGTHDFNNISDFTRDYIPIRKKRFQQYNIEKNEDKLICIQGKKTINTNLEYISNHFMDHTPSNNDDNNNHTHLNTIVEEEDEDVTDNNDDSLLNILNDLDNGDSSSSTLNNDIISSSPINTIPTTPLPLHKRSYKERLDNYMNSVVLNKTKYLEDKNTKYFIDNIIPNKYNDLLFIILLIYYYYYIVIIIFQYIFIYIFIIFIFLQNLQN